MTGHSIRDVGLVASEISPASRLSLNCERSAGSYACKLPVSNALLVNPLHSRRCEHSVTFYSANSHKTNTLRKQDQKNTVGASVGSTLFPMVYPQSIQSIRMELGIARPAACSAGRKPAHCLAFLLA